MRLSLLSLFACAGALLPQGIEIQAPAYGADPSDGFATAYIQAAISRDGAGKVQSIVYGTFTYVWTPRDLNVTGIELRQGKAGETGPMILRAGTAPRNPIRREGVVEGGGTIAGGNPAALAAMEDLAAGKGDYYFNIVTEDQPAGAFRGQISLAQIKYHTAFVDSRNHVPSLGSLRTNGYQVVYLSVTRNGEGRITSAMGNAQASFLNLPAELGLKPAGGLEPWNVTLREGTAGSNGPIVVDFGSPILPGAVGVGAIPSTSFRGIDVRNPEVRTALERLLEKPSSFYVETTASTHPEGLARAQLRTMDRQQFEVRPKSANVVPPTGGSAEIVGFVELVFTRDEEGTPNAGLVFLLADFGAAASSQAMKSIRIHDGVSGQSGPAIYALAEPGKETAAQVGRWQVVGIAAHPDDPGGRALLDYVINYSDRAYLEINGAEITRAQITPQAGTPRILSVTSAAVAGGTMIAPGGLISIRGENFARLNSGLEGWDGESLPIRLNGIVVEIAGRRAPILMVSRSQINVQVPFETPLGTQSIAVHNGEAPSEAFPVTVGPAPSVFAQVLRTVDSTLIDANNPASAGDVVEVYGTGFGQTSPSLATGRVVPSGQRFATATATASLGGENAEVIECSAVAGLPGMYQAKVRIPAGPSEGVLFLVLKIGETSSYPLSLTIR